MIHEGESQGNPKKMMKAVPQAWRATRGTGSEKTEVSERHKEREGGGGGGERKAERLAGLLDHSKRSFVVWQHL